MCDLISVIIPTFNSEEYIVDTLLSVSKQTCNQWECIIVDDGSTDQTIKIVKEFINSDCRFKLLERAKYSDKKGGSVSRNIGLNHSLGEFIIFLDSDDLISHSCIQRRLETAKNKSVEFYIFNMQYFYDNPLRDGLDIVNYVNDTPIKQFLEGCSAWQTTCILWRKSFIKKLGGFDESYPRLQDHELHTRALMDKGASYIYLKNSEPDCYYRIPKGKNKQDRIKHLTSISLLALNLYIQKCQCLLKENDQVSLTKYLYIFAVKILRMRFENRFSSEDNARLQTQINELFKRIPEIGNSLLVKNYIKVAQFINLRLSYGLNKRLHRILSILIVIYLKLRYKIY